METGIYREVQAMVTDVKRKGIRAYNEGNKEDDRYYSGKLETLEVVLDKLERHGLRYDEHGASGRRDGKGHASAMAGAMEDLVKHSISNATEYRNMDILVDKAKVLVQQLKAAIDEVNQLKNG